MYAETFDTFLADFTVGIGATQFSGGGFGASEFYNKYNRVTEIFVENEEQSSYAGQNFR